MLLEVKLPYDRTVWSVCHNFLKGRQQLSMYHLSIHHPISIYIYVGKVSISSSLNVNTLITTITILVKNIFNFNKKETLVKTKAFLITNEFMS